MKREEIRIRDPFILPFDNKYYLYGTTGLPGNDDINDGRGFLCYVSEDLENWSDPVCCFAPDGSFWGEKNFWAPEVHIHNGKFYMLASFIANGRMRATQALVSDSPTGPFKAHGEPLTPENQMCLDGTLYYEDGKPYLVYCREWVQVGDGEICAAELNDDFSRACGEPFKLFGASESGWAEEIGSGDLKGTVTDGPFLIKDERGIFLFWSSFYKGKYAVGAAHSASGKIHGAWTHFKKPLFEDGGGHGMIFRSFDGKLRYVLHRPNDAPHERLAVFDIVKSEEGYCIK